MFRSLPKAKTAALALCVVVASLLGPLAHGRGTAAPQEGVDDTEDSDSLPRADTLPIRPPFWEGPLSNDSNLPVNADLASAFREGDQALATARDAIGSAARRRALETAFEAWARVAGQIARQALDADLEGVPSGPSEAGPGRLIEGARAALTRRIATLSPIQREEWRKSFGSVARVSATETGALAWPGTLAAAGAGILALDRALESDHRARAEARRDQARALIELLDEHPNRSSLGQALERREQELERWNRKSGQERPAWKSANSLDLLGSIHLLDRKLPVVVSQAVPGRGTRPGLVALDRRSLLVQTANSLWRIALDRNGRPTTPHAAALDRLLGVAFGSMARPRVGREAPGWELLPQLYDGDLFLVHGAREGTRDGVPNAICRMPIPKVVNGALGGDGRAGLLVTRRPSFEPHWVLSGDLLWRPSLDPSGTIERVAALAALEAAEWQPGFVFVDDVLVVQARVVSDRIEAWLVGLDPRDGSVLWTRRMGDGAGQQAALGRFAAAAIPRASAPALLSAGGRVLACTQLGLQSLVDPETGELLWTLTTRRRDPSDSGWSLTGPFNASGYVLLAPPDSDRLYSLRMEPVLSTAAGYGDLPLFGPIRAIASAEALLGASRDAAVVLRRDGRERTISLLGAPGQAPVDAFHLGPQEAFRGRALVSDERVLASTDRALYLLDAKRDLSLLAVASLDKRGRLPGGDVHAVGPFVIVLGFDALWVFACSP